MVSHPWFEKHKNRIFDFTIRNAWFSGWFYAQNIGWNGCLALRNQKTNFFVFWNTTSIWTQMDEKLEKKQKTCLFFQKSFFFAKTPLTQAF